MPFRPVYLDHDLIGQSLPWDLYTVSGVLVAVAGLEIGDERQLTQLTARPLFRRIEQPSDGTDLATHLRNLMRDYPHSLKAAGTAELEAQIRDHARALIELSHLDHDACLGLTRLLPMRDSAARHCLLTALIALDVAEQLPFPDKDLEPLLAAALTMNISAMRLHAELSEGFVGLNDVVRQLIHRHVDESLQSLIASGVQDPVWLEAVRQHHENLDGSGYPEKLLDEAIGMPGRILRVADYYVAKITGRRYRPAKSTQFAFKQMFGHERGRLDSRIALQLLHSNGLYPPGTLVRLANRETAVVMRREGDRDSAGHAMAFMEVRGKLIKEPVERNTASVKYAVLNVTEPEPHWPEIRWEGFWGY